MRSDWRKYIGPGPLVAAAFIGPGTVTVCTLAGVRFGYDLLWALALSIVATVTLQEMAARIGLVQQQGLARVLSTSLRKGFSRYFSIGLVFLAIVIGNAAFEAGNISGGAMGAALFFEWSSFPMMGFDINPINLLIGIVAFMLLWVGSYEKIVQALTSLVILMSLAFLLTAILSRPHLSELFGGFLPKPNTGNILLIVSLIGTTVVPYNLFLHSSLVAKKWKSLADLNYVRIDTLISVVLGGIVSMAIVVTAAASGAMEVENASDLALGMEKSFGIAGRYFIGFGLFAAGITSAVTAPLAGAFVVCDCFGFSTEINLKPMRISMVSILFLGLLFSSLGIQPVELITLAQLANGMLLPLISGYILWLVNRNDVMKNHSNSTLSNVFGFGIWLITLILGGMSIWKVLA